MCEVVGDFLEGRVEGIEGAEHGGGIWGGGGGGGGGGEGSE